LLKRSSSRTWSESSPRLLPKSRAPKLFGLLLGKGAKKLGFLSLVNSGLFRFRARLLHLRQGPAPSIGPPPMGPRLRQLAKVNKQMKSKKTLNEFFTESPPRDISLRVQKKCQGFRLEEL
jgi:hypothetical protein